MKSLFLIVLLQKFAVESFLSSLTTRLVSFSDRSPNRQCRSILTSRYAASGIWIQLANPAEDNSTVLLEGSPIKRREDLDDIADVVNAVFPDESPYFHSKVRVYTLNEGVEFLEDMSGLMPLASWKRLRRDRRLSGITTSMTTDDNDPGPLLVVAPREQANRSNESDEIDLSSQKAKATESV